MKVIFKPRGFGKTTELVKLSAENQIPILCLSTTKLHIEDISKELGLSIPPPIAFNELSNFSVDNVYVDNAEYVLKKLLGIKIEGITIDDESIFNVY